ncbi:P-loop containing nucleoside triphosphate hydrolase protein [Infundibulicybe gibba]|nr:P-loop containing nucleoside triphosphate hydrolase protein [Infundibulicybe gibba]
MVAPRHYQFLNTRDGRDRWGKLLGKVLLSIVEPPLFWSASLEHFARVLEDDGQESFAWLLLQLISLPEESAKPYTPLAEDQQVMNQILTSSIPSVRMIGSKIKHVLDVTTVAAPKGEFSPGGRHDNDFIDFREVSILPTADEIISNELPFLRPSESIEDPNTAENRMAIYLDNQFRLLREDMLAEMREELHIALGRKKGYHRGLVIERLKVLKIHCGPEGKRCKWGIMFQMSTDLPQLKKVKPNNRKAFFTDHRRIFMHQSLTSLLVDNEIVAFPIINRDEELLARNPPIIILQFEGETSTRKALTKLKLAQNIKLIQIDTAIFSFEPILRAIQRAKKLPLSKELLFWTDGTIPSEVDSPPSLVDAVVRNPQQELKTLLGTTSSVILDKSQAASLVAGLTQKLSLIQGPPGTGKSFIGALLAKVLHDTTSKTILVVCYTNHALDQFLEDLLKIGIPASSMVRLGGKSTPLTEPLSLYKQKSDHRFQRSDYTTIDALKAFSEDYCKKLEDEFSRYTSFQVTSDQLLDHLEFEDPDYFEAFRVPKNTGDMTRVGKKGRAVHPTYLLNQWSSGWDAGIFKQEAHVQEAADIWSMTIAQRRERVNIWKRDLFEEQINNLYSTAKQYNTAQMELSRKWSERDTAKLQQKRIIGCTTTAAAKYCEDIQAASPSVLLVEEAGEILESHILTALGRDKDQLILIGDHKQLRPKINSYKLSVEKGEGYDLNRSLFERLVLKGYPHETLSQQHRMRPEISALIRELTYPDLTDAADTQGRPNLRGVTNNIVLIDHQHPEDDMPNLSDRNDLSTSSKQNTHEVEMVLKIVRYLAQQGYGTDKLVILTPYLGQLRNLAESLKQDNDPILNDLDSFDLVKAGLLPAATAQVAKKPIRLATIDNYQGEESEIVIVSLTRSNSNHDIGFMFSPERLNVLLSRARNALIMIGNTETFSKSRKGGEIWNKLFGLLKKGNHIYDGLPVACERHPDRKALLCSPADFDNECPDGGCKEPCGTKLNCGLHDCPSKCHQIYDHSKMPCEFFMQSKCDQGHNKTWKCSEGPPLTCSTCEREAKQREKKAKEAFRLQKQREAAELAHAARLAEVEQKIQAEKQNLRDAQLAEERRQAIQQKEADLQEAMSLTASVSSRIAKAASNAASGVGAFASSLFSPTSAPPEGSNDSPASPPTPGPIDAPQPPTTTSPSPENSTEPKNKTEDPMEATLSKAKIEWDRQKQIEGASNDAIDALMEMTGLEAVKSQVLKIKSKVDTCERQGVSLKNENFNVLLQGNPGTGKTTVARHYAKFLTSVGILSGNEFVETTASNLANDGVPGVKKQIEDLIKNGGGVFFIDEAYMLTSEHNFQGKSILDHLLAEMENNKGKVAFVLAGYKTQMEKFFQHNPGLQSRVPYVLDFIDYTDKELHAMLIRLIEKEWKGRMKIEDGLIGLFMRIAIRRLGRGRGREGFGNARDLHTLLSKVRERQADRLTKSRAQGKRSDDFLILKEDLIGPDPSEAIVESAAWIKLQKLTGLKAVKNTIRILLTRVKMNYLRELKELEPMQTSFNRVFVGSPGTGKTTVAKLYGRILADLGLLSSGEVITKNPADFVGSALGQSEANTKAILNNTIGKVLIIDEAYMLYGGGGSGNKSDPYKTAVIDTIVAEVQSVIGEDRCVLLLGYKDQMEEMFLNVNPGLSRRFPMEDAFHFEDFNDSELLEILNYKLGDQHLSATEPAKAVAIEALSRLRNRPNFGNAGAVENLLSQAKGRQQLRQSDSIDVIFEPQDFDPNHDRDAHSASNLDKLFEDVVGCEEVVSKLRSYQGIARTMRSRNMDPRKRIPMNFIFKGPPGTGKTTTARKMGQVYRDMGLLSSGEVIECSVSDLVGQYVGQTGPKTKAQFEKALGQVLFVDEAYRLAEGHFAQEAMDEMVTLMTDERFRGKLVIILAGYDKDMNRLMGVNSGLSSRFPDSITFKHMAPQDCLQMLVLELTKEQISAPCLADPSMSAYAEAMQVIQDLSCLESWGNGRDVKTLSTRLVNLVFETAATDPNSDLCLSGEDVVKCMRDMLSERWEREKNTSVPRSHQGMAQMPGPRSQSPPPETSTTTTTTTEIAPPTPPKTATNTDAGRDPGVSDQVWLQLQAAIRAAEKEATRKREAAAKLQQEIEEAAKREHEAKLATAKAAEALKKKADQEAKRKLEDLRLQETIARAERERLAAAMKAKQEREEKERREEAKAQAKLRDLGKVSGGYRCAGGAHFVDNAQLGM